ncbi:MAG TPA: M61 family peptidase [Candidatus Dormibacteraeota bacterium]|nr:M61 family peptidase [Candidatus Dormibacteraeota bacterium]
MRTFLIRGLCLAAFLCTMSIVPSRAATPILLELNAGKAPTQNIVLTHEIIPATAGPMTLYYPKWIPGEHQPVGPIANLASLVITADGKPLSWRRDPLNMFAFKFNVPAGATAIDVRFTYLGATFGRYSSSRLATHNIFVTTWNQNLLYPSTGTIQDTYFKPTIVLPGANWKFATALTGAARVGNTVTFDEVSLEHLIDSPLDAGTHSYRKRIWHQGNASAYLNVFADTQKEADSGKIGAPHYAKLVREMIAMYGARHWRNYNFLLTLSDQMPGEGIEHHESSDDGEIGAYFLNPKKFVQGGDLLSHEFNHSWDGKYRMPLGLYPPNLQIPYDDSLLWVYEGMTQYYGDVMSFRDGIRSAKTFPDQIAAIYAYYDNEPGRLWRSLGDTATSGPFLYAAPYGYNAQRRSVDFYAEGALMWLRADSIIRAKSGDKKSLDTFARAFFGGKTTGPIVVTYTRKDIIAGLNKVLPYDWTDFFHKWIDRIAVHPPNGFTPEGWKLVYTTKPTLWVPKTNFWYSVGLAINGDQIVDVKFGSPAANATLGINTKVIAIDGRAYTASAFADAIAKAATTKQPLTLLVEHSSIYRSVAIDYTGGLRYPHMVRIKGVPDRLMQVVKPYTK